ncbi:dienelactone hydrolase family protein [Cellulosimicrobium terreum]|nr:dienelactone hydrolase family protein [Cellulosimicrobium terreum]
MAEVLLFHHARGLTYGVQDVAQAMRDAGHAVHVPDLFEGRTFDSVDEGVAHVQEVGFDTLVTRAQAVADGLDPGLVYAGISMGVVAAQALAQTRTGAKGAVLLEACVPVSEFGEAWPEGVPVQVHGMEDDPEFAGAGDLDAARELVGSSPDAELFLYPGRRHLFTDPSLTSFDPAAGTLVLERVIRFLDGIR